MGIKTAAASRLDITGLPLLRRGKVRDVYDLNDKLLIISTDRLSAFDWVLETPIPDKGRILTEASAFWFELTQKIVPNHFLTSDIGEIRKFIPPQASIHWDDLSGRAMLVKKARRVNVECIARGYLAGSGFKEYQASSSICGEKLPPGLKEASPLPTAIFTPSTKADQGHDQNISFEALVSSMGSKTAERLKDATLKLYDFAAKYLLARDLILADTKFEFGFIGDELILIDEALTPDSSRIWDGALYREGSSPPGFDKQFVRDYLETTGWDKNSPPPPLPPAIADRVRDLYLQFLKLLKTS